MAIGSFVTGLTSGVFQGMDWRESREARKRRQEIVDQELEWRKEDRGYAAEDREYTREERARARKEQDRAIQMRDAELAAWSETVDGMLSSRGTTTASTSGSAAAPEPRDPYAVPPPAALSFGNLDAPGAMTASPVQRGQGANDEVATLPGPVDNPSQRSALTVPEVTPSPRSPQRPQDPEADPDKLPAERRNGAPPSSQAELSIMDMAVQAARDNARSGKASDGPRSVVPQPPEPRRPEQGPPAPQEMSIMDMAVQADQLNAMQDKPLGQTRGQPMRAPQGNRPSWLPQDYLNPAEGDLTAPETGPVVNQTAPVQASPYGPNTDQSAVMRPSSDIQLPGGFNVTPVMVAPALQPMGAGSMRAVRDAPLNQQDNPPAPAPPPPAAVAAPAPQAAPSAPAPAQAAPPAPAAPQVPTTAEGTPVASVAVAAATSPPKSADLSFGVLGKDAAVKATPAQYGRAAAAATKVYTETQMPAIVEHYLRTGQVEKAAAFEKFVADKKTQKGIGEFMKAAHALNIGDEKTALTSIAAAYNTYYDDGFEALPGESDLTYDEGGALTGGVMVFRNTQTGELFKQQFNGGRELMIGVLGAISPESTFEDLAKSLLNQTDSAMTETEKTIFNAAMKSMQAEAAAIGGATPMSVEEMTARAMALAKGGGQGGAAPASSGITEDDLED